MQASAQPKARPRPSLWGMMRFDFCMSPREATSSKSQGAPALCGAPLCSGMQGDLDLNIVRVPRCDIPRCGQCTAGDLDTAEVSELSLVAEPLSTATSTLQRNLTTAQIAIREVFAELEAQCVKERAHYEEAGLAPPRQKSNVWATYTNKARVQRFLADSMEFVRQNADCRTRIMTASQLRFLVLLQHYVSEDTNDFYRPESQRRHQDAFEGVLTDGVNAQLVKDAHRSEFSVEGRSFSLQDVPQDINGFMQEERRQEIAKFQTEFVMALEACILNFCSRRGLSPLGTRRFVQAVTTQMSQAGLANLDRGSQATRYSVGSNGLDQRTAYNLSTMHSPEHGESLKLSILCMKTGFVQYLEKDDFLRPTSAQGVQCPKKCKPSSYLYQYATFRFTPVRSISAAGGCESTTCTLLDALDEAHIDPATE